MEAVTFLNPVEYPFAERLQKLLVQKRVKNTIPDTVLFLEHTPVITLGRKKLAEKIHTSYPIFETQRGGQATYHGPGQLIIYPIIALPMKDLHAYLHHLEHCIIMSLKPFHIHGCTKPQATGVWIKDQKIASIGIGIHQWITYHGISLNISNELTPFFQIQPCGFSPHVMTRLIDHAPEPFQSWPFHQYRTLIQSTFLKSFQEIFL